MSLQPSASAIIPAFNAEKTIVKAVRSAWSQTYPVHEVIVADDGSTDLTADLAERAGAKVLRLQHQNADFARNAGAEQATGDLLFFLDSDDWWDPNKVSEHVKVHTNRSPSFVIDIAIKETLDGVSHGFIGDGEVLDISWEMFLDWRNWSSGSSFSISRENYFKVDGFREDLRELQDIDFFIRAAHLLGAAYRLRQPLTHYVLTPGSTSRKPQGIISNFEVAISKWNFMSTKQLKDMRRITMLSAARHSKFPKCLEYYKYARWPVLCAKFWRSLVRSIINVRVK